MLQTIPTRFLPDSVPHAARVQTPLIRRCAGWLLRCWESQCRQAERPDRVVPYY